MEHQSKKKKLELDKETIRRLRKRDLEEVVGGAALVSVTCKDGGYGNCPVPAQIDGDD